MGSGGRQLQLIFVLGYGLTLVGYASNPVSDERPMIEITLGLPPLYIIVCNSSLAVYSLLCIPYEVPHTP